MVELFISKLRGMGKPQKEPDEEDAGNPKPKKAEKLKAKAKKANKK